MKFITSSIREVEKAIDSKIRPILIDIAEPNLIMYFVFMCSIGGFITVVTNA